MDTSQAKFILRSFRHHGQDAVDPAFAEALELARHDPDLAQWLTRERELDALIAQKIQQIAPPADLRTALLMNQKISSRTRRSFFARTLAWAACLAVVVAVFFASRSGRGPVLDQQFQAAAVEFLESNPKLQFEHRNLDAVKDWLAASHPVVQFTLPQQLQNLTTMGCHRLSIRGRNVAFICFQAEGGRFLHLFVVPGNRPRNTTPEIQQHGSWALAQWQQGTTTYLLATAGDQQTLERYL